MNERPLDFLAKAKGKRVVIEFSNGRTFSGVLKAFDLNQNIVLENVEVDGNQVPYLFLRSVFGVTILD